MKLDKVSLVDPETNEHVNYSTHIAVLRRKEEGYVIINAHPAFGDPYGLVGRMNEPARSARANMMSKSARPAHMSCRGPRLTSHGLVVSRSDAQLSAPSCG